MTGLTRPAHGPRRAPRVPFALLVAGLVLGCLCALLALNTASAANELSRHNLAIKDADVAAQVQQLQNEVAASAAPGALGQAAAALGMVPGLSPAFLQVGADGRVRLLGSPAPVSGVPVVVAVANPRPTAPPTSTAPITKSPVAHGTAPASGAARSSTPARLETSPATHPPGAVAPTPTPTSTPTPTTTLPGGAR
ncbi:MAG: cell division protein FtsL [Actinomycetota bacterium]|nr:cell division protein FtsL [Actinomycetota bacterium]